MAISTRQETPIRHFWRALVGRCGAIAGAAALVSASAVHGAEELLPTLPLPAPDPAIARTLGGGPFCNAGGIEWARLSPDGKTIFAAHLDLPRVSVFDARSGLLQSQIPLTNQAIDMTGDGRLIAGIREDYADSKLDHRFGVWRWPDRSTLWTSDEPGLRFFSRFSPDGRTLAVFTRLPGLATPYVLQLLESETGRELWRREIPAARETWASGLEWVRGDWVMVTLKTGQGNEIEGDARIFRADSGASVEFDSAPMQDVTGLMSGAPRHSLLVANIFLGFRVIRRTADDRLESVFEDQCEHYSRQFHTVEISPDGRRLFAATHSYCRVYDVKSGKLVQTIPRGLSGGSFSPDGSTFLGIHGFTMTLISTDTWETRLPLAPPAHRYAVERLAFSPDGSLLASMDDQKVLLWDWRSGRARGRIPSLDAHRAWKDMVFHPKDTLLATGYGSEVFWWDFGKLPEEPAASVADAKEPPHDRLLHMTDPPEHINFHCLSFSAEGQRLLSATNQWASMLELGPDARERGLRIRQLTVGPIPRYNGVEDAKVRPDAQRVSIVAQARVRTYELEPERLVGDWRLPGSNGPGAFSPDGRWYASHAENGDAAIFDVETGALEISFPLGATNAGLFGQRAGGPKAWSSDGTRLAGVAFNSLEAWTGIYIWDMKSGRSLGPHPTGARSVTALAFAPDGRHLALASSDGSIDIWDLEKVFPQPAPATPAAR